MLFALCLLYVVDICLTTIEIIVDKDSDPGERGRNLVLKRRDVMDSQFWVISFVSWQY